MFEAAIMPDDATRLTPERRCAPATGCFGQLRDTAAYGGAPKRRAEEVFSEWEGVAHRFYLLGYRDGQASKD